MTKIFYCREFIIVKALADKFKGDEEDCGVYEETNAGPIYEEQCQYVHETEFITKYKTECSKVHSRVCQTSYRHGRSNNDNLFTFYNIS